MKYSSQNVATYYAQHCYLVKPGRVQIPFLDGNTSNEVRLHFVLSFTGARVTEELVPDLLELWFINLVIENYDGMKYCRCYAL